MFPESLARTSVTVAGRAIDVSKWLACCVVEACHSGVFFCLCFFPPFFSLYSHGLGVVGVTMWRLGSGLTPGGFEQSVFSTRERMGLSVLAGLASTPARKNETAVRISCGDWSKRFGFYLFVPSRDWRKGRARSVATRGQDHGKSATIPPRDQ